MKKPSTLILTPLIALISLSACHTTSPTVIHTTDTVTLRDTLRHHTLHRDTIHYADTTLYSRHTLGDTILIEKLRTITRTHTITRHDTIDASTHAATASTHTLPPPPASLSPSLRPIATIITILTIIIILTIITIKKIKK